MRAFSILLLTLVPGLASAHPGHLIDVAGHDHIAAGIAIGVAIGVAIWGALKGKPADKAEAEEEAEEASDEDLQEA